MAEPHPDASPSASRCSLKKTVTRRILPRPSVCALDEALLRQMLLLSEQRRSLAEQLEEASAERTRLQVALSGGGWRRGLFCAPIAGLGPAADEASRRILHQCGRNKQLAQDLQEAERRLEWAECGLRRVQENLALASRRVDQRRSDARHVARLAAELRAAAADVEAALVEARPKRRALSKRLRHTNRAVERALTPDKPKTSNFPTLKPGHATAYKALQLRVRLLELEQQLGKQHRQRGVVPRSIVDVPRSEEMEAESLLQLQEDLQQQQELADTKAYACQQAQLRIQRLHLQMAQITAAARECLNTRHALVEGLVAAWQEERAKYAERLHKMEEREEAYAAAEGVLDTALSLSASSARAVNEELQRSESEVSALSNVAVSLLAATDWKAPTVEEYLGAKHYYELVLSAKARREQLLLAVQNLWSRLREAEARSKHIRGNLQADQRLAAALDARLLLCQQHKAYSSLSVGGEAITVRAEFLEAEARDARVAVALAEEETARLEVVCAREAARVRLLYEHALGVPLCDLDTLPGPSARDARDDGRATDARTSE